MVNKMLISGGNGFLGSYLAEYAVKKGFEVTVVDDFSTSKERNVPQEVKLIREKIENFETSEAFDYVVHLAARPSPEDYINNPIDTLLSNSLGTLKTLEIARKGNSTYMYTSSSEIYGDADVLPTPETYYGWVNSTGIRSCYDEGKRFSEALIMAYHRQYKLNTRIQRPFNVYGPRIREDGFYGRVIPRFILQALKNDPLTVHGDGMQTRSFLYVSDWLDASWKLLTYDGLNGEFMNIGATSEITILELATKIISLTDSKSSIVHMPAREDDPRRRSADITKAKKLLKWQPETDLSKGLESTIKWMRSRL
ncbi:MAG: NAD-dependent epimerase/dehydratase family protein [Thermoplasmata archaeon]